MKNSKKVNFKFNGKNYIRLYNAIKNIKMKRNDTSNSYCNYDRKIEKLQLLMDLYQDVSVSFSIGCRNYYRTVKKIGNGYYLYGRKMTKGSGYYFIEEISEITQEMVDEMVADSHYY